MISIKKEKITRECRESIISREGFLSDLDIYSHPKNSVRKKVVNYNIDELINYLDKKIKKLESQRKLEDVLEGTSADLWARELT